jgi:hypothetical protein
VNYKTGGSHCVIDSGCTQHMTGNPWMFTSLDENVDGQDKITFGDNSKGKVQGLGKCNALNLGVEFFLLFSHQIRALLSFLFPCFAHSSQFQTSIVTGVRVMYKPKPKCHGCCIMPKHISWSDVECSSRSVPDFDLRFNSV